jgi:hypothetical protein
LVNRGWIPREFRDSQTRKQNQVGINLYWIYQKSYKWIMYLGPRHCRNWRHSKTRRDPEFNCRRKECPRKERMVFHRLGSNVFLFRLFQNIDWISRRYCHFYG